MLMNVCGNVVPEISLSSEMEQKVSVFFPSLFFNYLIHQFYNPAAALPIYSPPTLSLFFPLLFPQFVSSP